jgi:hypothetical protein
VSSGTPWWASDDGAEQLDDQDAFRAHRAARAGRESLPQSELADALGDVAVSVVRRLSSVTDERRSPRDHFHGVGEDPVCRNCPVCSLLRAIDRSGPEVSEHLGDAARHLALAAASFLEALGERPVSDEAGHRERGAAGGGVVEPEDRP